MAGMKGFMGNILRYLPMLAILAPIGMYAYERGMNGLIADLKAVSVSSMKKDLPNLGIGIAIIIAAQFLIKLIPNRTLRYIVLAVAYYFAVNYMLEVIKQGAAGGFVSNGNGAGVTYSLPAYPSF